MENTENRFAYEKNATTTYESMYTPQNSPDDVAKFYALIGEEQTQQLNQQIGQMAATAYNDPYAQTEKMVNTQTGISDKREKQLNYYGYNIDDYQEQKGLPGEQYRKTPVKSFLNLDPNAGPVKNVFDLLCRPLYAITGSLENLVDEDSSSTFVQGAVNGLMGTDKVQGVDLVMSASNQTYDQLSLAGKALGFAIDIFADPLTYVNPFGAVVGAIGDFASYAGKAAPAPVKNVAESVKYGFTSAFSTDKNTANKIEHAVNRDKIAWENEVAHLFTKLKPSTEDYKQLQMVLKNKPELNDALAKYYPEDPTGLNSPLDFLLADIFQHSNTGNYAVSLEEINRLFLDEGKTTVEFVTTDSLEDLQKKLDDLTIDRRTLTKPEYDGPEDRRSKWLHDNSFTIYDYKSKSKRGASVFTVTRGKNVKLKGKGNLILGHSKVLDELTTDGLKFVEELDVLNKNGEFASIAHGMTKNIKLAQEQFIRDASLIDENFDVQDMFAGSFSDNYLPTIFFDETYTNLKTTAKINTSRLKGGNSGFTAGKTLFGNLSDIMDPNNLPHARQEEIVERMMLGVSKEREALAELSTETYDYVNDIGVNRENNPEVAELFDKFLNELSDVAAGDISFESWRKIKENSGNEIGSLGKDNLEAHFPDVVKALTTSFRSEVDWATYNKEIKNMFKDLFGGETAKELMKKKSGKTVNISLNDTIESLDNLGVINPLNNTEVSKNLAKSALAQNSDMFDILKYSSLSLEYLFKRVNNIGNINDFYFDNYKSLVDDFSDGTPEEIARIFDNNIAEVSGLINETQLALQDINQLLSQSYKIMLEDGEVDLLELSSFKTLVDRSNTLTEIFRSTATGSSIPNDFNNISEFQKNVDAGLRDKVRKSHEAFPEYTKLRKSVNDISNGISSVYEMIDDAALIVNRGLNGKNRQKYVNALRSSDNAKAFMQTDTAISTINRIVEQSTNDVLSKIQALDPTNPEGSVFQAYTTVANGHADILTTQRKIIESFANGRSVLKVKRNAGASSIINMSKQIHRLNSDINYIDAYLSSTMDNHGLVNPLVALEYKYQHIPNQVGAISTITSLVNMLNDPSAKELRLMTPGMQTAQGVKVSMQDFFSGIGGTSTNITNKLLGDIRGMDLEKWNEFSIDMHPDLYKMFQRSQNTEVVSNMVNLIDNVTSFVKGGLLFSFSYHWGNLTGNMFNAYLSGVNPADMMMYTQRAKRLMTMYDNILNDVALDPKESLTPSDMELLNTIVPFFDSGLAATKGATKGDRLMNDYLKLNQEAKGLVKLYNANFNLSARPELWQRFGVFLWAMDPKNAGKIPDWVSGDKKPIKLKRYYAGPDTKLNRMAPHANKTAEFESRIDNAIKFTEGSLFNYSDLTHFENTYLKRIIPFYTFMKKNAIFSANVFMNDPRKVTAMYKFNNAYMRNFKEVTNTTESQIPDYAFDSGYIPSTLLSKNETISMFKLSNPVYAGLDTLLSPVSAMKQGLNPMIKTPIEMMTNTQLYNGMPMYDTASDTANFDYVKTIMSSLGFNWMFNITESVRAVFQTMSVGSIPSLASSGSTENLIPSIMKTSSKSSVELQQLIKENAKYSGIFEKYGFSKDIDPVAVQVAGDILTRDNSTDTANLIKMYMLM